MLLFHMYIYMYMYISVGGCVHVHTCPVIHCAMHTSMFFYIHVSLWN